MNKEVERIINLINIQQKEIKVMERQILIVLIADLALLTIAVLSLLTNIL